MRKSHILLASLALLLISCSDPVPAPTLPQGPDQSATAVTSTTEPSPPSPTSSTVPTPSATAPAPSNTDSTEPESMWPADPPGRSAVFEDGALSVVVGTERYEISEVAEAPTAGGFVADVLVFSVGCCDGIWAWDADSDRADLVVDGGDDDHVTLHGVAPDWEQPGFFYTTGGDQTGDEVSDLMFYDLGTGEPRRFLDMSDRRPGLTAEEQSASVGRGVTTEDLVGILFAFGDGTWVEWYTDTGEPAESPFGQFDHGDMVLDLALAPDGTLLALGREEHLHHGITTVEVVATADDVRSFSVPDQQSLRHLQFDGRYVTASVHSTDPTADSDGAAGRVILDIEQNHFSYSHGAPILAVGESEPTE